MRRNPFLLVLSRLLLALALIAPHAARSDGAGGLSVVICGASGPYEIALDGGPAMAPARSHDCCLLCAPTFAAAPPHAPPVRWAFASPLRPSSPNADAPVSHPEHRPRDPPVVA